MPSEHGRVVVKARPTFVPEQALGELILNPLSRQVVVAASKDREAKQFTADGIYLPEDGIEAVYKQEVQPLVQSVHQGFNATILAYGASASGKTHTMLGNKDSPGLANLIIEDLFARYDARTCTLTVAIQELYEEEFTDLVAALPGPAAAQPGQATPRGPVKQHSQGGGSKGYAKSLEGRQVQSSSELKQLVHNALRKRKTAATLLNARSSRSHAIITLTLRRSKRVSSTGAAVGDTGDDDSSCASSPGASRATSRRCSSSGSIDASSSGVAQESPRSMGGDAYDDLDGGVSTCLTGKLYLVDLAGAENVKRSGAEGKQQAEAGVINKSLCHLKTVVTQVFEGKKVSTYRNSKLTYKLRDALGGGNSKLLFIACISTASADLAMTKATLQFAEMARCIKNSPTVNREPKDELITRLQLQVKDLQDQLDKAAQLHKGVGSDRLLLQQLSAVEAAYAELQEDMEAKEAEWTADAEAAQQRSSSLQQQLAAESHKLCAAATREAALQRQQTADQAEIQQLQQELQQAQAAQAESVALLLSAESDLQSLGSQCGQLQLQMATQQKAADTARELCGEQQQQAQLLCQQLQGQADEAKTLQQQLQQELAARARAEQLTAQLREHLKLDKAASAAAQLNSRQLQQQLQHEAATAATAHKQLQQQLAELKQQLHEQKQARIAAETVLSSVGAAMQQVTQDCSELQQQLHKQQRQHGHAGGSCSSCVTGAGVIKQQLDAEFCTSKQLRQELHQQQLLLQAQCESAAEQAAQLSAQLQCERDSRQREVDAARAEIAKLHKQFADEQAAHAAHVAEMQRQHAVQLESSLQNSVQKLQAHRLRCKQSMALQVRGLKAAAQSLSEALSLDTASQLPETPTGTTAPVPAIAAAEDMGQDVQLQQQQHQHQQQQCKQNSRYQQVSAQPEGEEDDEQQQGEEAMEVQGRAQSAEDFGEQGGDDLDSENGLEPAQVGASSASGSSMFRHASPSLTDSRTDSPADNAFCSVTCAYLKQSAEPAVQLSRRQQQQQHEHQHGAARSSGGSVRASLPILNMAGLQEAAASAEGVQLAPGSGGSWPAMYREEAELDVAAAQGVFAELAEGKKLTNDHLRTFLKPCRLGGKLHRPSLSGKRKQRRHLIQDMLAYHQHAMLRSSSSGASNVSAATAGLPAEPSSSGSAREAASDVCMRDNANAAAATATAEGAGSGRGTPSSSRTPHSFSLGSSKGAAAAASLASGSLASFWGLLTPRSVKKKQKAAAAAAAGSSSGGLLVRLDSPRYEYDIAASPGTAADTLQQSAGAAAVAEGVVDEHRAAASLMAVTGGGSAVERLLLQMQSDPTLGSPGLAVRLEASMAAGDGGAADSSCTGDVRVLQNGGSLAHRNNRRCPSAKRR